MDLNNGDAIQEFLENSGFEEVRIEDNKEIWRRENNGTREVIWILRESVVIKVYRNGHQVDMTENLQHCKKVVNALRGQVQAKITKKPVGA